MEAILLIALLLVVAVKAYTGHSINALEAKIRVVALEEGEVSDRLQATESSLRALEKEHKALEQEIKHLENDKDLATLEVAKVGGRPITEDQFRAMLNPTASTAPSEPLPDSQTGAGEQADSNGDQADDAPPELSEEVSEAKVTHGHSAPRPVYTSAGGSARRPRILVVDDNDELRALLIQALNKECDVMDAPDGFEALSQVMKQKDSFDLVITDLNMPR
ncbi:MAG: response regulator [bacterium]|nr:response regulator [bacterium]